MVHSGLAGDQLRPVTHQVVEERLHLLSRGGPHAPGCHDAVNKLERLMSLQSTLHFVPDVLAVFIMNEAVPNPRSLVFGGMGA